MAVFWHNQIMLRLSAFVLMLAIAGCAAEQPDATLCAMPVALRGWGGAAVRMTGIVVGGKEHGFYIMDEDCPRGGDLIVTRRTGNRDRMLKRLDAIGVLIGVTRMDVEAKIAFSDDASPKLLVTRYYGGSFQPMSEQQLSEFNRRRFM